MNMKKKVHRHYWAPRILAILYVLLMMFPLGVFHVEYGANLEALIHSLPALILVGVLIISWKYEEVGGIMFILGGLLYIFALLTGSELEWEMLSWALFISGPAFVIGFLFLKDCPKSRG